MFFINSSETIGQIIAAGTLSITGTTVATLLLILMILMAICMVFNIPLEFTALLLLPFCIVVAAYNSFMIPVILILVFVATIFAKNWIFK